MKLKKIIRQFVFPIFVLMFFINAGNAQIRVVNMVPQLQSNQTANDVEPNIAVNPANKLQIVGTAFTPDPMGGANAPIYISTDGGNTWALNSIIPGNDPTYGTGDITARFAGSGNQLYVGTLRGGAGLTLNILRVPNFTAATTAELLVSRTQVDQPYVQAATVLGGAGTTNDRVYVTTNDWNSMPQPAAANLSLDAFSTPVPGGFATNLFPNRSGTIRVMPGVRPSIHPSGVVYMAFYNTTASGFVVDVVVARDDNWGTGASPFQNLLDSVDSLPGQRVVTGRTLPAFGVNLGNSRLVASNVSIAVDPTNAAVVYVSWADRVSTTDYTLHVRRSDDSGQTWSGDLLTLTNATNPALAVNSSGKVGYLYQQLTGTGAARRWETHLRRSTNGGSLWDDVILSTSLMSDPGGWLGDYVHLMAVGKDFYGIFSASNFPDTANFPQGVAYQRNANFTSHQLLGTDNTTVIGGSMDPFFFQVTEITDDNDFFVRDFTNSTTDFDPGLEPSTYPWFYVNSDVWNRRSNAAGGFNGNNQPQSEDPWQTTDGHNYAFARVHRKAAGAAQNVTLHYLYSEFGTGSNYVNANTTPDPTVSFAAADLTTTPAAGYEWELPVTSSTHTCLAVEISTPGDPIIAPSLLNHAPGWSNGTDLMVLNDNNKAQRNMEVYRVPTGDGSVTSYAAIHNSRIYESDLKINWKADLNPRIKVRPSVAAVTNREKTRISNNQITLMNMKPGETRYIKISYPTSAGKDGEMFPVVFGEVKNGPVINGFTVARQSGSIEKVVSQNVSYESLVFRRISKLYDNSDAETIRRADLNFIQRNKSTADEYLAHFQKNLPALKSVVTGLVKMSPNDPFGLAAAFTAADTLARNKKSRELTFAHLSLLNSIDVFLTSLQLEKGNSADYLQTVYVQKDVAELLRKKKITDNKSTLLSATGRFIDSAEKRRLSVINYPEHVKEILPELKKSVEKMPNNAALLKSLNAMGQNLNDIRALQKEHMNFLLSLRAAVKNL
jgi:hypothetical protein